MNNNCMFLVKLNGEVQAIIHITQKLTLQEIHYLLCNWITGIECLEVEDGLNRIGYSLEALDSILDPSIEECGGLPVKAEISFCTKVNNEILILSQGKGKVEVNPDNAERLKDLIQAYLNWDLPSDFQGAIE